MAGQAGVDEDRIRQRGLAVVADGPLVVVGDDQIDAELFGDLRLIDGGDAAVDGDDEGRAVAVELFDGLAVEAVALVDAVGDVGLDAFGGVAEGDECVPEDGGGGDAVDVVVAVDGELFTGLHGFRDPFCGVGDAGKGGGVDQVLELGPQELACGLNVVGAEAAVDQAAGGGRADFELPCQLGRGVGVGFGDDPGLPRVLDFAGVVVQGLCGGGTELHVGIVTDPIGGGLRGGGAMHYTAGMADAIRENWWALVLFGLGIGTFAGLFGLGGGVLMVPLLVLLLKYPQVDAQATSLAMILSPLQAPGWINYWRGGHVQWPVVFFAAPGMLVGSFLGSMLGRSLPEDLMRVLFAVVLGYIAAYMIFSKMPGHPGRAFAYAVVPVLVTVLLAWQAGVFARVAAKAAADDAPSAVE